MRGQLVAKTKARLQWEVVIPACCLECARLAKLLWIFLLTNERAAGRNKKKVGCRWRS
jgi:hypothetical protein